jgi:group I intron endonuclease
MMPTIKSGKIYLITNLINNKKYVGITIRSLKDRWQEHLRYSRNILQKAIKKYGKENFKIELVEELHNVTEKDLLLKETFYINKFDTFVNNRRGYNAVKNSEGRLIFSKVTKQKMSINHADVSGYKNPMYKRRHTNKSRRLISQSKIGTHLSKKHKIILSLALKGEKSYRFDKTIRTFKNINTNEIFVGVQYDFKQKYNFKGSSLCDIMSGRRKSYKGWILVDA